MRFVVKKASAGMSVITDTSDNSIVAMMLRGERSVARTEAMAKVMTDALNAAVERPSQGKEQTKN